MSKPSPAWPTLEGDVLLDDASDHWRCEGVARELVKELDHLLLRARGEEPRQVARDGRKSVREHGEPDVVRRLPHQYRHGVAAEALVKPGNVGALDVGSSIGCGIGLLLGRGGSGTWSRAGGVEGSGAAAMAPRGSTEYPACAGGEKPKPARSLPSSSISLPSGAAGRGSTETGQATGGSAIAAI